MLQSDMTESDRVDPSEYHCSPFPLPEVDMTGTPATLNFESFSLLPRERLLFYSGERLRIGDRALDILIALVRQQGQVVSKSALLEAVWPHLCVDENSLRVHVLALRRILDDGKAGRRLIITIVGRGYSFVGRANNAVS
jgi:DNA-binding winged helix-turn-helix (wHTH) protein